ncbi:MAG: copper chaperone PCu(A)C [Sphingomicrobium sp.]
MRSLPFGLLFALAVASCTQATPVEVTNVWARDSAGRTTNAAVFMTIRSRTADRLVAASTSRATTTDLMTMQTANGAMRMVYVEGFDVPAGTPVQLNSSGLHVWLEGLRQPLKAGESFPLTLKFAKAGERLVDVRTIGAADAPPTD